MESIKWLWFGFSAGEGANITPHGMSNTNQIQFLLWEWRNWFWFDLLRRMRQRKSSSIGLFFGLVMSAERHRQLAKEEDKRAAGPNNSSFFHLRSQVEQIEKKERGAEWVEWSEVWFCCLLGGLVAGLPANGSAQGRQAKTNKLHWNERNEANTKWLIEWMSWSSLWVVGYRRGCPPIAPLKEDERRQATHPSLYSSLPTLHFDSINWWS